MMEGVGERNVVSLKINNDQRNIRGQPEELKNKKRKIFDSQSQG